MPYVGAGTTTSGTNTGDPDGWVICDGQVRTVADGRFVNLAPFLNTYMGVATNTSNSITPPDLRGSFIYGQSSAATTTKVSGGAANVTLAVTNLPSHSHTATDSGHTHTNTLTDPGHTHNSSSGATSIAQSQNGLVGGSGNPPVVSAGTTAYNSVTGMTINNVSSTANITVGNTGSGTAFSILPPYVTMNYIMKY